MTSNIFAYLKILILFLPFVLFQFINHKMNYKKEFRYKQFIMPIISVVFFVVMFGFINSFYSVITAFGEKIEGFLSDYNSYTFLNGIKDIFIGLGVYIALVLMSTAVLLIFMSVKRTVMFFFRGDFGEDTVRGTIVSLFYEFDEEDNRWYLKKSCSQMRTFLKVAYYTVYILSIVMLLRSFDLTGLELLTAPFCPALPILVIGELYFWADGILKEERKGSLTVSNDNARHIAMYALLRKPLKKLFGDKLSAEGTTINVSGFGGGSCEDILASIEKNGDHIGRNYAAFIRKKIDGGLAPNADYLRSGYDLALGKSLLFNTPFYDKLIPYAFYAANRVLLSDRKVLVVMGRHGTEDDLIAWCQKGMSEVTNVPNLYNISVLSGKTTDEDELPDIGIISRSGVHDLDMHKANMNFLKKVGFVVIIEPSRLVTTAQIGLNLLIKCCGDNEKITFCSVDRNCDGLVDSLSHILMTDITEVSATEYPHGMSSFMCWKADSEHLQHRLFPGISRYLGLGTELSFVALKNQVKQTVWYGGDVYPVLDAHWISKQYYYDFLKYANLPTSQESFDQHFKTSFNMCNESVSDNSYITVEDDRNNLFEARRNFATIAESQGFINVISSEYMLREYMADNVEIFTSDAKAIPYITADYARTKRNSVLALCLLLCVGKVSEKDLARKLMLMGIEDDKIDTAIWKEICLLFSNCETDETDEDGNPVIYLESLEQKKVLKFDKASILLFKREYMVESGKFENVYTIENKVFADIILDSLQNAGYIAELESKDYYIGTELKGHVYQKYLPGQFFTLNGKYYEMISTTPDNRILVRRASDHISGRTMYRQLRRYTLEKMRNSDDMGALKTVNNIDIHYLNVDFKVETDGYWKLKSYNDFENGTLTEINGVPTRKYYNKQILKLDFSKFGDLFTDSVRKTLTVLLNEVFVTLFAENQPFISAVTPGECEIPATYSLSINDPDAVFDNCIYIIEDSQLDIGLLVAVERNIERIMQIVSDYLNWNSEKIEASKNAGQVQESAPVDAENETADAASEEQPKKKGLFGRIGQWFKSKKKPKKEKEPEVEPIDEPSVAEETPTEAPVEQEAPVEEKAVQDEAPAEETAAEPEEKPKKKGLFGRRKSKKKEKETENAPAEEVVKEEPANEATPSETGETEAETEVVCSE